MEFEGYLIKSAAGIFPHELIKLKSYKSTPNQREEIEAYRDDYTRDLTRITASGTKSAIEFATIDDLTLEQKKQIQSFFSDVTSDALQRKVRLTFWNDEDNAYYTKDFYIPDIEYNINRIKGNNIYYNSLTYKLTEY